MQNKILEKLGLELKLAESKEKIALNDDSASTDYAEAIGYTNGLLEAIDIVRRVKDA